MTKTIDISETLKPKSDQLNADDLIVGPITVTITDIVVTADEQQPVAIAIEGFRPFKPCKSMRRVIAHAWGKDAAKWIGRSMTLYRDPDVKYGGEAQGGVRISHLSGIEARSTLMTTIRRGKRALYHVDPLVTAERDSFDKVQTAVDNCKTPEQFADLQLRIKRLWSTLDDEQKSTLTDQGAQLREQLGLE